MLKCSKLQHPVHSDCTPSKAVLCGDTAVYTISPDTALYASLIVNVIKPHIEDIHILMLLILYNFICLLDRHEDWFSFISQGAESSFQLLINYIKLKYRKVQN